MTILDQQLHGYRNGHQLLSSSAKLSKADQDLVDRLSDVAGPLRPGEHFDSYLTCYPLPSGSYYVIARTWQDLDAPRAGCVRTRSYFIPVPDWTTNVDILALVKSLTLEGPTAPAKRIHLARETGTFASVTPLNASNWSKRCSLRIVNRLSFSTPLSRKELRFGF